MNVSIIIPTYNSGAILARALESIKKTDFKGKYEIIIVDGHSKDNTVDIAKSYDARILYENVGNRAGACNIGVKNAKYDFIAFTDDDCVVDKNWLKELTSSISNDITSVGGPNITPKDDTKVSVHLGKVLEFFSIFGPRYAYTEDREMETFHNPGCNVLYRKSAIIEAGYFDEKLITCEDEELDYRIKKKGKIMYNPRAKVMHYRRSTFRRIWKQSYRYAIGRVQAAKKHSGMLRWFHVFPSFFMISLLFLFTYGVFNMMVMQTAALILFWTIILMLALAVYIKAKNNGSLLIYFSITTIWLLAWSFGFIRGIFK